MQSRKAFPSKFKFNSRVCKSDAGQKAISANQGGCLHLNKLGRSELNQPGTLIHRLTYDAIPVTSENFGSVGNLALEGPWPPVHCDAALMTTIILMMPSEPLTYAINFPLATKTCTSQVKFRNVGFGKKTCDMPILPLTLRRLRFWLSVHSACSPWATISSTSS